MTGLFRGFLNKSIDEYNASVESKDDTGEGEEGSGKNTYKDEHKQKIYVSDRRWWKIVRLLRTSAFLNGRDVVDLMDCFLIRYCIWNDADQIGTVFQFVNDAVEKHGYNVASGMGVTRKELAEFRNQIEAETSFIKEVTIKIPEIVFRLPDAGGKRIMNREYYRIPGRSDEEGNLISKDEFSNRKGVYLGLYYEKPKGQIACAAAHDGRTRKTSAISIAIDGKEYELQCAEKTVKQTISQKPQSETEQAWDFRIDLFLEYSGGIKDRLRNRAKEEAPGLRTNLFVQSDFARFIQSHITQTRKELKRLEIEIREIQHAYRSITAGEIIK
jgi:MoxR-like ATPase